MELNAANPTLNALAGAPERPALSELREAGEGFEALFLALLLKGGRAGLPGDDLLGGAAVRSSMEMLDARLAQEAAGRAGLGVAEAVARQFAGDGVRP